jgi:hypothetical protein
MNIYLTLAPTCRNYTSILHVFLMNFVRDVSSNIFLKAHKISELQETDIELSLLIIKLRV